MRYSRKRGAEPRWLSYLSTLFRVSIKVPGHGRAQNGYINKGIEKSEYDYSALLNSAWAPGCWGNEKHHL